LGDAEITEREVCFCQGIVEIAREQISEVVMRTITGLLGSGDVGLTLMVT